MANKTVEQRRQLQRRWRSEWVDGNLADSWLESLNSLAAFDLISICEGHPHGSAGRGRPQAHINLRIKSHYLPIAVNDFDHHSEEIREHMFRLFGDGLATADIELRVRVRIHRGRPAVTHDLVVKIKSLHRRTSELLDDETRKWFEAVVKRVELLDSVFSKLLACAG